MSDRGIGYVVTHVTTYEYPGPVPLCHCEARLRPRNTPRQAVLQHAISIEPRTRIEITEDYFGNVVQYFSVDAPHTSLAVTATSTVRVSPRPTPIDEPVAWERARDQVRSEGPGAPLERLEYLFESPYIRLAPEYLPYANESFTPGRPLLEAAIELTQRLHEDFTYSPGATFTTTPLSEVFQSRKGVCQDFAHLQIAMLRALGLPARYVSGYVHNPPDGERLGFDASHAWLSLHCPHLGWVDLDPTNGVVVDAEHITLAWGRDFGDVSPLRGVILGSGLHVVRVGVQVENLGDSNASEPPPRASQTPPPPAS